MPTKQVTYRNDKAVLVRVYVEKPRENKRSRSSSTSIQHHHHHYHIHHTVRQEVAHHGSASKGYDRRSGLLMYSRLLRDSARGSSSSSTPLLPKWFANNNPQPPTQMAAFQKKPKHAGRLASFGNWKLLIPTFLISWSNAQKKDKNKKRMHGGFSGNGIKKLQVRRGKGIIPKVLSTCKCA